MIFSSFVCLFAFLPLALAVYYATPARWRNATLTLASYVFYAWWRPDFLLLMWISTVVDFVCARHLHAAAGARRRGWLLLSLLTNLGLLAYFKYANLVVHTIEAAIGGNLQWQDVVLPVGISFYTFQSLSYTIDVYRGQVRPVRSLLDLACYVSMFPQLVAGPIVRFRDIRQDLVARQHTFAKFSAGALLFEIGFAKKILLADNAALIADPVFAAAAPGLCEAWLGVLAYALQIYFDFSGYSDMAIGLGLMLGFRLPENFNAPYRADSITEFWRRWHISLSSWLRDYLYISLGGNRGTALRTYRNLMLTMLLGGLWHGAAWTFLLWGGYQGLFLVIERLAGKRPLYAALPRPLRVGATFVIVLGGWAVFRADGLDGLGAIFGGLSGLHGWGALMWPERFGFEAFAALVVGVVVVFSAPTSARLERGGAPWTDWWVLLAFLVALSQLAAREFTPFIYSQF